MFRKPRWLTRIEIVHLEGSPTVLGAPETADALDRVAHILSDELRRRRDPDHGGQDPELTNEWLASASYNIILACYDVDDEGAILQERTARFRRYARGERQDRDLFKTGLMALFAHNNELDPELRRRLAARMWYGFRHYIPPALLPSFCKRYSSHNQPGHDWRLHIEADLEGWIIEERGKSLLLAMEPGDARGPYKSHIENEAAEIRRILGLAVIKNRVDW